MISENGKFTREEIYSQPQTWQSILKIIPSYEKDLRLLASHGNYEQVIFTGCGSTYYLSLSAAAMFMSLTQCYARAFPASELWLHPDSSYGSGKCLLVTISRSGETTETVRAIQKFQEDQRGDVLSITCYPESTIAQMGKINIVLSPGAEKSIAQTRAFTSLFLSTAAMAMIWSNRNDWLAQLDKLPDIGEKLLDSYASIARRFAQDQSIDRFYFLGSGIRYGLACELSLKMKEMSLSHSEPFHFLEFRHGPISMVTPDTLIFALVSERDREYEMAVVEEIRNRGAKIFALGESDLDVNFLSGIPEACRQILYLPVGQVMAFERSLSKDLNPDKPNNLSVWVQLES